MLYSASYGLALSPEGKEVFVLTQERLLSFEPELGEQSSGRWINIDWGEIPEPFWYAVVP